MPLPLSSSAISAGKKFEVKPRSFSGSNGKYRDLMGLLLGPKDSGKAQPLHSKILTPNGWTTIGEVSVGDEVIAGDGSVTVVTGVFNRSIRPIYRICFDDGSYAESCDEHSWSVRTAWDQSESKPFRTIMLSEFMNNLKTDGGINRWRIPIVEKVQFSKQHLPIHPYTMGVLIGDGSITSGTPGFTVSHLDNEISVYVANELHENVVLTETSGVTSSAFRISKAKGKKNPTTSSLIELGLFGTHSYEKFIPKPYLYSSIDDRIELLRGLMDTDGTVAKNGSAVFTTTSQRLRDDVIELIRSLGGIAYVNTKRSPFYRNKNGERVVCRDAFNITASLPNDIVPFKLKRKASSFVPTSKYRPNRVVCSVEYVGQMEARCITVAHNDQLYVTDNYIVTHNSSNLTTIPKASGKKHVFLTADSTTASGIKKFTAKRLLAQDPSLRNPIDAAIDWADKNIEVYELTELYDPTDIKSSPGAAEYILQVFDKIKQYGNDGKLGAVAIEHYDYIYSKIGVDLCREQYNIPRDGRLKYQMYDERGRFLDPLDSLIETIKCDSLWLVGYGEEDKTTLVPIPGKFKIDPKTGEKKEVTEVQTVKSLPKWIIKRQLVRNSLIRIDLETIRKESELSDGTKVIKDNYMAQVVSSKHPSFDVGVVKDITNVGLAPFFDGWWKPQ